MANATISFGPKLGLLSNAAIDEVYYDQFRPFLRGIDALVQSSVLNITNTPPPAPNGGDAYIVATGGTGAWSGQDNKLAVWSTQSTLAGTDILTSGWDFYSPKPGWSVYNTNNSQFYYVNAAGTWVKDIATVSVPGSVIPDGTTITVNSSGVISSVTSVPVATAHSTGVVQPDGVSISVNGSGVISVPTANGSTFGIVKPDGTTVTISGGVISATGPTATVGSLGLVKPDGTSININGGGMISVPVATGTSYGIIKPDGTSVTVTGGILSASAGSPPTATNTTLGVVKPDNTTITIAAGVLTATGTTAPTATNSTLGIVRPDNSTITISAGVLTAATQTPATATSSVLGIVKPDNSTITIAGGVLTAATQTPATATTSVLGVVKPDGSTIDVSGGVISVPTATTSILGLVKPDGSSVTISGGVISAAGSSTATSSSLGIVKPDNTTIGISSGVLSILPYSGGIGWGGPPGTGSAGGYFVQATGGSGTNSASFGANVTVGNTIIVAAYTPTGATGAPESVTDSLGNTYTLSPYAQLNPYGGSGTTLPSVSFFISNAITTGGLCTLTVNAGSYVAYWAALEYSGLPSGSGASTINAGVAIQDVVVGPTPLSASSSLVVLFHDQGQNTDASAPTSTGATQRFITGIGASYSPWVADYLVAAGSYSATINNQAAGSSDNITAFIAIGL